LKAGDDGKAIAVRIDRPRDDLLGSGVFQMRSRVQYNLLILDRN
jgi:hypothetical protein